MEEGFFVFVFASGRSEVVLVQLRCLGVSAAGLFVLQVSCYTGWRGTREGKRKKTNGVSTGDLFCCRGNRANQKCCRGCSWWLRDPVVGRRSADLFTCLVSVSKPFLPRPSLWVVFIEVRENHTFPVSWWPWSLQSPWKTNHALTGFYQKPFFFK